MDLGLAPPTLPQSRTRAVPGTVLAAIETSAPGQPEPRHRLTPGWLLSQAGGSAEPAKATDAKCRHSDGTP